jgi:hypothetical protein
MVTRAGLVLCAIAFVGCTPELDDRRFLVKGPSLLAIASTPAEAEAPAEVSYRALYVDPKGERSAGDLEWAFCTARRALTDEGTVSPACLSPEGADLVPIGAGSNAKGALPMDACRLFGPDPPEPMDGMPAGRPVDPDPSGGYYQPVRLLVRDGGARYAVGATRLGCGLADAAAEVAADFGKRYRRNESPAIASLALVRGASAEPIAPDAIGAKVKPGEKVTLRASWAVCPSEAVCGDGVCGSDEDVQGCPADCTTPKGCSGAEPYLLFDPTARTLVTRREEIRVSWFATGGELAEDVVGRSADETKNDVENAFTAPSKAGEVRLWLVIRDDRGGIGWQGWRLSVGE